MVDLTEQIKNLRVSKKVKNIVFVGHVDSGKSTICGRILVDLGLVDTRTLEKYKQQSEEGNRSSWYLSWCMDLNPEERSKGITIELGTASFDLPNSRINILDAPGHKQFVNEMIEGASRADVGILIVSARNGEFEAGFKGGITREHLLLLKAGNVESVIVLVNKMDDVNWEADRFEDIKQKISKYGKSLFKSMYFIPVSGYNGDNIKTTKTTSFYNGPSFLVYLDQLDTLDNELEPCILILEKIKTSGNTYYYGKVESGEFNTKTEYKILPLGKEDKITSITNEDDIEVETEVGETYKIRFKEYNDEVGVGHRVILKDNTSYSVTSEFYSQMAIFEVKTALTVGYTCIMHINLDVVSCKIIDMFSLDKKRIRVARKGDKIIALIKLESAVVVRAKGEQKDRFSLRDESLTIAAGVIKKIK